MASKSNKKKVGFERIPSPLTYYSNYNKQVVSFPEQHKSPNCEIWTWNQPLKKFNTFNNQKLFDQQMKQRSLQKKQFYINEFHQEQRVSQDQKIEKQIINKTDKLLKSIRKQNKMAPVDHRQKVNEIKKNRDLIDFIDFDQRKLYSNSKSQMDEISKINQEMSKEALDRKGLALRIVLSSIPMEKLQKLLFQKGQHMQKTIEKLNPINSRFQLDQKIKPKFKSYSNVLPYLEMDFRAKYEKSQKKKLAKTSHGFKFISKQLNRTTSKFIQHKSHNSLNQSKSQNNIETKLESYQQSQEVDKIQFNDVIQNDLDFDSQIRKQEVFNDKKKERTYKLIKDDLNMNLMLNKTKQKYSQQDTIQNSKNYIKIDSLNMQESPVKEQLNKFSGGFMNSLLSKNNQNNSVGTPNQSLFKGQQSFASNKQLKFLNHQQSSQNLNNSQSLNMSNLPQQSNQLQTNQYTIDQILENPKKFLVQYDLTDNMKDYLDLEDFKKVQILKQLYKMEEKINFFNFDKYYYQNYAKKNKGILTNLSHKASDNNQDFEKKIEQYLQEVENELKQNKQQVANESQQN